jgi:transposase
MKTMSTPFRIPFADAWYPPVRDILRRRLLFVRQRTSRILSLQSAISRNLALKMSGNAIKKLKEKDAEDLFDSPFLVLTAKSHIAVIDFLTKRITAIESAVKSQAKVREEFQLLETIPGIGNILALTIMLEVGDIGRFPKVGNYSSYCRCVKSEKISNKKKKGENNRKNGNKYLSWAYVEAANFAIRFSSEAQKFYQRKMAKTDKNAAIKALSNKLGKASYYIMRDQVSFDSSKLFG